ncbi:hypothetical protein TDB9533_04578 [Thalassocella blandensis]|nr:hypothetical protein TDB9533_04578 [Thalassocella blandensis]
MVNSSNIKTMLIVLTIISVVADTMVLPFYPQFFDLAFNVQSAEHVGFYIAACCFTVMVAFPFWAKVARYVHELHLWIYTQLIAAALGFYCYHTSNLVEFWVASQLMLVFKASYLLIYPFVMRLEEKDKHLGVASLFAVLMHFGGIGGAIIGGYILNWFDARDLYLIMPASDILQVVICMALIYFLKTPFKQANVSDSENAMALQEQASESESSGLPFIAYTSRIVWKLCIVSALFYFSAFLIRPFFTRYWEYVSGWENTFALGLVYSIPAWVALVCLWLDRKRKSKLEDKQAIIMACGIGLVGLFLQGSMLTEPQGNLALVILGRCLFGLAFFHISVRLEVMLFSFSKPERYATDFSKIHFFQNVGVIASSFLVGYIVNLHGVSIPFPVALFGLFISSVAFYLMFMMPMKNKLQDNKTPLASSALKNS